ncbi:MAG: hypothetical protein JOZ75_04055 [Candidatus Dormibacteraeota bacterium]|nr:hypothetical protein [Candidatus Dormibacteraeota bacterium]
MAIDTLDGHHRYEGPAASIAMSRVHLVAPRVSALFGHDGDNGIVMTELPTSRDALLVVAASAIGVVLIAIGVAQGLRDRKLLHPEQVWNRRRNFTPAALVLAAAVYLIPDVVDETEALHHVDEYVIYTLGAAAITWLLTTRRFTPSRVPIALFLAALIATSGGAAVEWGSTDAAGDILVAGLLIAGMSVHCVRLRYFYGTTMLTKTSRDRC